MTDEQLAKLHGRLPVGEKSGTSIKALRAELGRGWSTRKIKQGIKELRAGSPTRPPVPVAALRHAGGVFIATEADLESLLRSADQLRAQARSEFATARDIEECAFALSSDPALFNRAVG